MKTKPLTLLLIVLAGVVWLAAVWGVMAWLAPGIDLLPSASSTVQE